MLTDTWPLVGRAGACHTIASILAEEPPRSLVIAGPAGVGRTRLAREALSLAAQDGRSTLWVAATGAAAHVPLGAFAHLIPDLSGAMDPLVLLQRATQAIAGGTQRGVLGVDDVHLLDRLSITLLHQLAATGEVSLVLTVRTGDGLPDPAAPLWKDGFATRIDVLPLGRAETEQLVSTVLNGEVETRTTERLWRLTGGNPLYLREMVEEGRRLRRFRPAEGLWRWEGDMAPSERLAEIVMAQLGPLEPEEWRALEVLATAEPLDVRRLLELSSAEAVGVLVRRGLVRDSGAGVGDLRAAQPVHTAVVRARASEATLRLVLYRLAGAEPGPGLGEQLVRRCLFLLDSDLPAPPVDELTEAAQQALAGLDLPGAERLSRAACAAGGGLAAYFVLAEATRWLGDPESSERAMVEAADLAVSDIDRARVAVTQALTMLLCGLGRADDAVTTLRAAARAVRDEQARELVDAASGLCRFLAGEPEHRSTEGAPATHDGATPLAVAARAVDLAVSARTTEALAAVQTGWAALEADRKATETVLARLMLQHAEAVALYLAGRVEDLERRTVELHRANLAAPEWAGDALTALHCGCAALARGRPRRAVRWLVEAQVGLRRHDPLSAGRLCRALLVLARRLQNEPDGRPEVEWPEDEGVAVFAPYGALADVVAAGAGGGSAEAGRLALAAGQRAVEGGHAAAGAVLLHHALRYGAAAAVAPLTDLARQVDAPLVEALAAHAAALSAEDAQRLAEASRRFQQMGTLLFAADAAVEAAAVHERAGARRAAAECGARGLALARSCGLSETSVLAAVALPTLTSREEEVAELASSGFSNQEIADRLVVSVRTVEAHLSHIYTKFGINSRSELVGALLGPVPAAARPVPVAARGLALQV